MSIFSKLFGRKPELTPAPVPVPVIVRKAPEEAARVQTQSIREYCDRLDAEANRLGNLRLRWLARSIRTRHNIT